MKIKIYLMPVVVCLLTISKSYSQGLNFGAEIGYHWYQMDELKDLNDETYDYLNFDAKITDNYPAYVNYSPFVSYNFNEYIGVGLRYTFNSTGSRISRKDYSGEYKFDSKIKSHAPSLFFTIKIIETYGITTSLVNDIGYMRSKLNLKESLYITDISDLANEFDVNSHSVYYDPGIDFKYPLKKYFVGLRMGYQIDIYRTNLVLDSNSELELLDSDGDNIRPNWSGFHLNLSVSVNLNSLFSAND